MFHHIAGMQHAIATIKTALLQVRQHHAQLRWRQPAGPGGLPHQLLGLAAGTQMKAGTLRDSTEHSASTCVVAMTCWHEPEL